MLQQSLRQNLFATVKLGGKACVAAILIQIYLIQTSLAMWIHAVEDSEMSIQSWLRSVI